MVRHPGHALDHSGHAGQRPQIGSKTVGSCALAEASIYLTELELRQFWFPPGPPRATDPVGAVLFPGIVPATDALTSDLQLAGNRRQDQSASREQTRGTLTAQFHSMEIAPHRSRHNRIMRPSDENVTIFCE
jgi:hypothetical protein